MLKLRLNFVFAKIYNFNYILDATAILLWARRLYCKGRFLTNEEEVSATLQLLVQIFRAKGPHDRQDFLMPMEWDLRLLTNSFTDSRSTLSSHHLLDIRINALPDIPLHNLCHSILRHPPQVKSYFWMVTSLWRLFNYLLDFQLHRGSCPTPF